MLKNDAHEHHRCHARVKIDRLPAQRQYLVRIFFWAFSVQHSGATDHTFTSKVAVMLRKEREILKRTIGIYFAEYPLFL